MTDKPKHRSWQIHLSTAVILMFVVTGLLALNLSNPWIRLDNEFYYRFYGWPMEVTRHVFYAEHPFDDAFTPTFCGAFPIGIDLLAAMVLVVFTIVTSEWVFRRRGSHQSYATSDTPKRHWFQMHLSTSLALMISIGGILGANMYPIVERDQFSIREDFGWPLTFRSDSFFSKGGYSIVADENFRPEPSRYKRTTSWHLNSLVVDSSSWLFFILATVFIIECFVRRREVKNL